MGECSILNHDAFERHYGFCPCLVAQHPQCLEDEEYIEANKEALEQALKKFGEDQSARYAALERTDKKLSEMLEKDRDF